MRKIRHTRRQATSAAVGNSDNKSSPAKSQFASKFSKYGSIATVALLSFLAVACRLSYHLTSDVRISKEVEDQQRRSLLVNKTNHDRNLDDSIVIDNIDCGDIFVIASQTGEETNTDERSRNQSALLCHYAKKCKSSGWPSRILLPLILCHGGDDSVFNNETEMMSNATIASVRSSQAATKTSSISTTLLVTLLFAPLLLYLILLFRLLATTADNYFSPALETFSFELGLPPRFAGATLLALGNGSPDLGSTVNAILLWNEKETGTDKFNVTTGDNMETQGWTMSIGDLIGGGMFVGTIVCGLLVNQCSGIQCRVAFLRDVSMYMLSVGYVWHVLESKRVTQGDAWGLLGIYVVYVGIVFCADLFHRKVTMERINLEAKERRKSISVMKALRLKQMYDAMRDAVSNLGDSADELTPIMSTSHLPSYADEEDEIAANERDDDTVPDVLPSIATSFERQFPRPQLSVTDRFAMLMSNYDPSSVRHIGSSSTVTDESKDSEVGAIYTTIHDIRPPLLRAVSPVALLDDSSTHSPQRSPPEQSEITHETLLETPRHSNIPSPPPSDTSSIASKNRSWSFALLIDAYEELVFQSRHFIENSFKSKSSLWSVLEMPFSIARVLTIPLPVEDHYCRPIVALSTACSPLWLLYYEGKDFFTVAAASFILAALMIALAILRYADEDKMPLIACIPLSLYGFLIAATWIDSIGSALVDLLQFFGTFLRIPPGILGMTVLAIGNSMGDLSANLALAKNGLPSCATTAVFAGPAFNLLVGVGCGFLALQRKLDTPVISPVMLNATIRIGFTFIIVNCLAIALCGIACKWRIPKRYSYVLFAWYTLFILFILNSFIGQLMQ